MRVGCFVTLVKITQWCLHVYLHYDRYSVASLKEFHQCITCVKL